MMVGEEERKEKSTCLFVPCGNSRDCNHVIHVSHITPLVGL
jgi:hypothetical protein